MSDDLAGSLAHSQRVQERHYARQEAVAAGAQVRALRVLQGGKEQ